ncbi:MAG: metallophosphoesterase [Proteobacteria bacterium]|nr:metallophosphoesterase [Pseudomonadota bacterium]MBU1596402.1 metallophosphoesterase [Pseudomonadota bacterium]
MTEAPPQRIAVFSDVHGNLEALRCVLADVDALGVVEMLNLGDMVGYGPEPEACVQLLRGRGVPSVLGNHEHGLLEAQARGWFNPHARKALDRTRQLLSDDSLMYFRTLPRTLTAFGALFVHGCPPGLVSKYLYELDEDALRETFALYDNALCFAGHTHELERISLAAGAGGRGGAGRIERRNIGKGLLELDKNARHILTAGSVGQPRDGNNKAKYLLWEPGQARIEVRFVPYDIARTAARIMEVGLPTVYADRLW